MVRPGVARAQGLDLAHAPDAVDRGLSAFEHLPRHFAQSLG